MKRLSLLFLLMAQPALAACPAPDAWAKQFLDKHYEFFSVSPAGLRDLVTAEFYEFLEGDWRSSSKHQEVGALGYDPWLGAQDGEMGNQVSFAVENLGEETAMVAVVYPFAIESSKSIQRVAHLVLQRSEKECWRLNDFITPLGESLAHLYSSARP
jgi:hypothetical protein